MRTLKRALGRFTGNALGRRTVLGKALATWRAELLADLGDETAVSTQQRALVDLAVRSKLLVDSVDAYVLGIPSPVNKQRRCLFPVVTQREALVPQIHSLLRDLGLERKAHELPTLEACLAKRPAATEYRAEPTGGRP